MRVFFLPRYLLGAALGVFAVILGILAAPAVAATQPMIIESAQAQQLAPGSVPAGSLRMSDRAPFATSVEHYTRTVGCGWRRFHYVAKCLSIKQSPPPAGSTAIYDPEKWGLTSLGEKADWCAGMRLASQWVRAAGATLMIAAPDMRQRAEVVCAAQNAGTVILQVQPHEADPAAYLALVEQATGWARSANPSVRIAFVLSTNPKYGATVSDLAADYAEAETYLGGTALWWLNVLPRQGVYTQAVATATQLLGVIQ